VSAVGTVLDVDQARFEPLAVQVCTAAKEISRMLGYKKARTP